MSFSVVDEYRKSFLTVCNACKCYLTRLRSTAFQRGYSAVFIASRSALREQEGFCTLQKQPRENTAILDS